MNWDTFIQTLIALGAIFSFLYGYSATYETNTIKAGVWYALGVLLTASFAGLIA
jgi:hypothetical protein